MTTITNRINFSNIAEVINDIKLRAKQNLLTIFQTLKLWNERINGQSQLHCLNDHLLRDVGFPKS